MNNFFRVLFFFCISVTFLSCQKDTVTTKAIYQGEKDMAWAIAHYVEYPVDEMQLNRAGIVKIVFEVSEEGKVTEVKATINHEIKEAEIAIARKKLADKKVLPINLPVVQSLIKSVEKLNFQPSKQNGKPVSSTVTTSVEFMLI